MADETRWQYAVANIGSFGAQSRLPRVLGFMGSCGYELVTVYDKASNWFRGMEKGFMLFKREVPPGSEPVGPWCGNVDVTKLQIVDAGPADGTDQFGFPEGQAW